MLNGSSPTPASLSVSATTPASASTATATTTTTANSNLGSNFRDEFGLNASWGATGSNSMDPLSSSDPLIPLLDYSRRVMLPLNRLMTKVAPARHSRLVSVEATPAVMYQLDRTTGSGGSGGTTGSDGSGGTTGSGGSGARMSHLVPLIRYFAPKVLLIYREPVCAKGMCQGYVPGVCAMYVLCMCYVCAMYVLCMCQGYVLCMCYVCAMYVLCMCASARGGGGGDCGRRVGEGRWGKRVCPPMCTCVCIVLGQGRHLRTPPPPPLTPPHSPTLTRPPAPNTTQYNIGGAVRL